MKTKSKTTSAILTSADIVNMFADAFDKDVMVDFIGNNKIRIRHKKGQKVAIAIISIALD